LADSAGVPIVGGVDALLIAVSINNPAQAVWSALCAIIGSAIGSSILFAISRKGGEVFLRKHISRGAGRRLHSWFERYGLLTVFIPAVSFIPLPMKIPVFCAGALEVRWSSFLSVVILARTIRYFVLAYLAQRYGSQTVVFLKTHALAAAGIALALALAIGVMMRLAGGNQQSEPG
jgi:membrane protein YqaA with SNARE-associated domain